LESRKAPGYIIGDSGYPCHSFCLTPIPVPKNTAERKFNASFTSTRNSVERMFGIWKRKYPCLLHLRTKVKTSLAIIVACAVLHNITRSRNDLFDEFIPDVLTNLIPQGDQQSTIGGRIARQRIVETYFS